MKAMRKIVKIDEEKCDGCGACVPSCAEGAIQVIDGKARLIAENLCDGIGNCLGTCPKDAITIVEESADEFDEKAVDEHLSKQPSSAPMGGCPGSRMRSLAPESPAAPKAKDSADAVSQLGHWPVQLALLPPAGPIWADADVLVAADCVPFAMANFHDRLLSGRTVAIACPKLDDIQPYIEKLTNIFTDNSIKSITVAHMEVPCCSGIVYAVTQALEKAGRGDIPFTDITIGIDGTIKDERNGQ